MYIRKYYIFIYLAGFLFSLNVFGLTAPNISANSLFLYQNSNFHDDDINLANPDQLPNGLDLQEAELQVYADVDPYTKLNMLLSISRSFAKNGSKVAESWGISPEELFVESNVVPAVTFKLGQFKAAMGKHNTLHTHAYPFIEPPLANEQLLGDGLSDPGISAAILLPSSWFDELTLQYLRGKGDNSEFNSPSPDYGIGLTHWKNLMDLSDELTMEIGVSYAAGGNSYRQTTTLSGADLTFKWRPVEGGRYHSLLWASEYLQRDQAQAAVSDELGEGLSSWLQYQFAENWMTLYRYDNLTMTNTFDSTNLPNGLSERNSIALAYSPSEFSTFKAELFQRTGGLVNSHNERTENAFFLQANFTIGAHPAHAY